MKTRVGSAMSRVHTALRQLEGRREKAPAALEPNPVPFPIRSGFGQQPEASNAWDEPLELDQPQRVIRPFLVRVLHSIMRRMGLRTGAPVPLCNGVTRRGLPCRGPAMANGYCRMHGGSRRPWVQGGKHAGRESVDAHSR